MSPNVNKSVHMYCAVQYSTCTVQCSAVTELVVDGYVTPESDEKCEDVKKLQKEAEVKEEMRVKLRKLRGMDSSQEEGGLPSSQVAPVSVTTYSGLGVHNNLFCTQSSI